MTQGSSYTIQFNHVGIVSYKDDLHKGEGIIQVVEDPCKDEVIITDRNAYQDEDDMDVQDIDLDRKVYSFEEVDNGLV